MQVVGHPDLHGWDGTNPPLIGDIVAAVIQEFSRDNESVSFTGPERTEDPRPTPSPVKEVYPQKPQHITPKPQHVTSKPQHITPIPAIPVTFSELQGLSAEKLSRLLDDESARQALLLGMASVVQMKDLRTDVRKGNVETARLTIENQDDARVLRNEGEKMKMELKALQSSYEGTRVLTLL